jgi:quercetin dioxygenase-like cupin family protein
MGSSGMYLKKFTDFPQYTDAGAVNQFCHDILPRGAGEARDLGMGTCHIKGPGQVGEDAHSTWTQYFLVFQGKGTLYYNGKAFPLAAGQIVEIPKNTRHYVQCAAGEEITYFFINQHDPK